MAPKNKENNATAVSWSKNRAMTQRVEHRSRHRRIREKQKVALIQFMEAHPELSRGELLGWREGKKRSDELWGELLKCVNAFGPPKSIDQWKKAYANIKDRARKKAKDLNAYRLRTGGASERTIHFSNLDARVIGIIPEVSMTDPSTSLTMPEQSVFPAGPFSSSAHPLVNSFLSDNEGSDIDTEIPPIKIENSFRSPTDGMAERVDGVADRVGGVAETVDGVRRAVTSLENKVEEGFSMVAEALNRVATAVEALVERLPNPYYT